jgi:hypothetical protein
MKKLATWSPARHFAALVWRWWLQLSARRLGVIVFYHGVALEPGDPSLSASAGGDFRSRSPSTISIRTSPRCFRLCCRSASPRLLHRRDRGSRATAYWWEAVEGAVAHGLAILRSRPVCRAIADSTNPCAHSA